MKDKFKVAIVGAGMADNIRFAQRIAEICVEKDVQILDVAELSESDLIAYNRVYNPLPPEPISIIPKESELYFQPILTRRERRKQQRRKK